jgi:ribonuclease E
MTRSILINDLEPGEVRVAVLDDGVLSDLFIEREGQRKYLGNIYKGRIVNLEPAIQAAFIDFGGDRNGFLHASDVMPYYADDPNDITVYQKRPVGDHALIQDVLHKGQVVLVQVTKDGIGRKGPTLTTYVSIPGKYMVLMPSLARIGVSKKIRDIEVRRRLKSAIRDIGPPEGLGVIVRTAGANRAKEELAKDLEYLVSLWETLKRRVQSSRVPATIYRESDLVIRTIRDVLTPDVKELIVDSEEVHEQAEEFLSEVMPGFVDRLQRFDGQQPLFHAFGVEDQIERLFQHRVPLKSGGSLIIEQTEALVSIDVNSGRFRTEEDLEETAWKMNMEAIPEICRQLRLRDLGGLIVIDMIDMRDQSKRRQVERRLTRELRKDKARVRVAPMSEFCLVQLTRQRVRPSLRQETYTTCTTCRGTGFVKSLESMVLKVLRDVRAFVRTEEGSIVDVTVASHVAEALQNEERTSLCELEERFRKRIAVFGDPDMGPDEVQIRAR